MASRTQMYKLLRLIDQGANNPDVLATAWDCWPQLPEEIQKDMAASGGADARRARIWAAAWDGGQEHVLADVEALEHEIRDIQATIRRAVADLHHGSPSEALEELRHAQEARP